METGPLQKNTKAGLLSYLPVYTLFWFLCAALICLVFRINGKSFIWESDGHSQHFISFNYLCQYLHDLILFHQFKGFFNYTLGQGMDILTTLDSYDFTDPVSILAALVFPLSRVQRYTLMIFMKLYLTGVSFLLYCVATERKNRFAVLAGAIAYTFSGAVLFTFARHPNYANWAYFFPFLLAGVEFYDRKKNRIPLIVFVFLNAITSFFTFYMNVILTALYVFTGSICRIVKSSEKLSALKAEGKAVLKLAAVGIIGILLAAFILLPSIHAYLNNYRVGVASGHTASLLHYERKFYLKMPKALFAMNYGPGHYTELGLNTIMFFPIVLLFLRKGEHAELKSLLLFSFLMLCIPLAGRIMNGFGYATNRWCYAVPFYVSIVFVEMSDAIKSMTRKEKIIVFTAAALYIICLFNWMIHDNSEVRACIRAVLIAFICVTILFCMLLRFHHLCFERCLLGLILISAMFQALATFSPFAGNYVSTFMAQDKIATFFANYSSSVIAQIEDGFYRTEEEEQEETFLENLDGYHGVNGTSFYWSLFPATMFDYYKDLGLSSVSENCRLAGLNERTGLLALASVKYYTKPASETGLVPYGYQKINSPDKRFEIFENQYSLPVGYTYSQYITRGEYDTLDGIEKEQALLKAAVLEAPIDSDSVNRTSIVRHAETLEYDLMEINDITIEDNQMIATEEGRMTLNVTVPDDCEVYLYLRKVELLQPSSVGISVSRQKNDYSVTKKAWISNINYTWPVLRDDVAFYLGWGQAGSNIIVLEFEQKARLLVDEVSVIAVPMSAYVEAIETLGKHVFEDVEVDPDRVTGKISVPEERILQFSIPYSDGWSAYVDGEKTELFRSDVMYLSVLIPPGEHDVELRYETPWLRTGVIISAATLVLWVGFELIKRKKTEKIRRGRNNAD